MKQKITPKQTAKKLKKYQIKKSVMAESLSHALQLENTVTAEHIWLDDNQPEPQERVPLIGFRTEEEYVSYSEEMK